MRNYLFLIAFFVIDISCLSPLDCDFSSPCCWNSADSHQKWDIRDGINVNEFRRTFLVGRSKAPPNGNYLMRIEDGEKGSVYQSCPFCAIEPTVTVSYRHWQSPTARLDLCWRIAKQPITDDNCVQIHSTKQSQIMEQQFTVPTGTDIRVYFLVDNTASETNAVVLMDRIKVQFRSCNETSFVDGGNDREQPKKAKNLKSSPSRQFPSHQASHRSIQWVSESNESKEDYELASPKEIKHVQKKVHNSKDVQIPVAPPRGVQKLHPTATDKGISNINIQKLTRKATQLNAELDKRLRRVKITSEEMTKSPRNEQFARAKGAATHPHRRQPLAVAEENVPVRPKHTAVSVVAAEAQHPRPPPSVRVPQPIATQNIVVQKVNSPQMGQQPIPHPLHTDVFPLPPPPPKTTSGKDFNPLQDLVGEEFSKFLDPSYVTKDDDEPEDEGENGVMNGNQPSPVPPPQQFIPIPSARNTIPSPQPPQPQQVVYSGVPQAPPQSIPSPSQSLLNPLPSQFSQQSSFLPLSTPSPLIYDIPTTLHPLQEIHRHPHQLFPQACNTAGGCLFDRSLCTYSHWPGTDPSKQFQLTRVHHSSFAQATVNPGETTIMESPTFMDQDHVILFDVLEWGVGSRLLGCCHVEGVQPLQCPYATPVEGSLVVWQNARFNCPATTSKLMFICENKGVHPASCALDNIRLHLASDLLLLEPCQKNSPPLM